MSDAPEKGVCDYAKRHRVVTHTSGNELQGPAITFGCYDSDRDARQALTDAGFTNGQWGWRNEYRYSTAHITPVLEYTAYRRDDLPPTLEAAMQLPEVRALRDAATQFAKAAMSGSDLGWPLVNLHEALAPFTEGSA